MNHKKKLKEVSVAYFEELSRYLVENTEKIQEGIQSSIQVTNIAA